MKFFAIATTFVAAASAVAIPEVEAEASAAAADYAPCSGLTGSPVCCGTSVDGILELDCTAPDEVPTDPATFEATCASSGKSPACCLLSLAGLALVCNGPVGV